MQTKTLFLITFLITGYCTTLFGQAGNLDSDFDGDGKVTTDIGKFSEQALGMVLQPSDKKPVVVGFSRRGNSTRIALARYNTNGTLDETFFNSGTETTAIGTVSDMAMAVAIQTDGKIVVAGESFNGSENVYAVLRYNTNGTLDNTFNGNGKVTDKFVSTATACWANAIAIQTDGKIVIGGTCTGAADFSLARLKTDGTLDSTFSADGITTTNFGGTDEINGLVIKSGKIIAVGRTASNSNSLCAFARYNSNGSLDNTFSSDGKTTIAVGENSEAHAVTLTTGGNIIAAGSTETGSQTKIAVMQLKNDGSLDSSFASTGIATTLIGSNAEANAIAVHTDGRVTVAGFANNSNSGGNIDFALARYNANGTLDVNFSSDGKTTTAIGTEDDRATAIALTPAGTIFTAGFSGNLSNSWVLATYNSLGNVGFSTTSTVGRAVSTISSMALQNDGKVVAAGTSNTNGLDFDFALARYNTDGSLDNTFNSDGRATTAINSGVSDEINSIAIQPDDQKIVAAGFTKSGSTFDFAVARFTTTGSLDNIFSGDGILSTSVGDGNDFANAVAIQADGKIVVAGYSENGANDDFALVRYNTNGSLDNTFSADGKVTTDFDVSNDQINAVVIQPSDGKIIAAGSANIDGKSNLALARYNTNGTLDVSFGPDGTGRVAIIVDTAFNSSAHAVVLQPDGKIIVAGFGFTNQLNADIVITRFNANGTQDNSFHGPGVMTDINSGSDFARSVALQPDGKIIMAAMSSSIVDSKQSFIILRYNSNGTLDNTFGTSGKLTTTFGTGGEDASAILMQPDGRIVAGGNANIAQSRHFAVARYLSGLNVGILDFSAGNNSPLIYPNPIQQNATLEYTLKQEEKISIRLFDIQGRLIKTFLENEMQSAGEHTQAIVMPDGLAAGHYLINISSPRGGQHVKMIK